MGWVFTPNHFKDLGSRGAIASALKRHKQAGYIRQLARGLYHYPKIDPELGILEPSLDEKARVQLLQDVRFVPAWIEKVFRKIAGDSE